jgi:hypothetical protein
MKCLTRRTILAAPAALAFGGPLLVSRPARAAKQYGPGVTDSEIKIGSAKIAAVPVQEIECPHHQVIPPASHAAQMQPHEVRYAVGAG